MEKALAVMDYSRYEVQRFDSETIETEDVLLRILSRCKYFECVSCTLHGTYSLEEDGNSFYSLLCVGGKCRAEKPGRNGKNGYKGRRQHFYPCRRTEIPT